MKTKTTELLTTSAENSDLFFSSNSTDSKISSLQKALNELGQLENAKLENTQAYCMMIWSTLELLSRFYSGQLGNQQATKRLKNFIRGYFPHKREHTEILLLFRNACMHSISLHATDISGKKEVRFSLVNEGDFLSSEKRTSFDINPKEFKTRLLKSIENYKTELQKNEILQNKFDTVYRKLGFLII